MAWPDCYSERVRLIALPFFLLACNRPIDVESVPDAASPEVREDAGPTGPEVTLEIGIPDPEKSSTFLELPDDGDVLIQDGGQGGTHALVALRFTGFGQWVYYQITIRDPEGGGQVMTPELIRPRPMLCDEALFECRYSPILVVIGGLAPKEEWDGLDVEISALVRNEEGAQAVATKYATLRR